jgi:hypothetical protein|tara:strand:- start:310 stop:591 length:282 start_codon:yes stop_codon:yes gene_type:complete
MEDEIRKIIEEISLRKSKDYEQMKMEEISKELHNTMEFEQNVLKKVELFEKENQSPDLIKYVRMICRNIIERETISIQETYLKKIDLEYLNSK